MRISFSAVISLTLSFVAIPCVTRAEPIVGPFWGKPYPYGYAWTRDYAPCERERYGERDWGRRWNRDCRRPISTTY